MARPQILILSGPTASGKTQVAFELSKLVPCEMICCDSMQIYRGMPIVTQSPPKSVTRKLKTHLSQKLDPRREYSAASFRQDALRLIPAIIKRKRLPLLVGGTGLYLRALLDGLFESEESGLQRDEDFRRLWLQKQQQHGGNFLHEKLRDCDPASAAKIHANDHRRLLRALEVYHLTGKPLSQQKPNRRGIREDYRVRLVFLDRERQALYERINARVDEMFEQGLIEEVRGICKKKLSKTAELALGIREIRDFLEKRSTMEQASDRIKMNTRRYAKRQWTWFRHEREVEWLKVSDEESAKQIARRLFRMIENPP